MRSLIVFAGVLTVAALLVPAPIAAPGSTVSARHSRYGTVLFDGRGFVLYAFTHDLRGSSRCGGARPLARRPPGREPRPVTVIPAPVPPPPLRRSFTCTTCSYGVRVVRPPERCPMCGERAWAIHPRRSLHGS